MYDLFIKTHFSAAHHLRDYDGKCANQHGHNWLVEVFLECEELDKVGMGVDFVIMKRVIKDELNKLDHTDLNEMEYFKEHNPTSENIAKYLFDQFSKEINDDRIRISKVLIFETPECGASYSRN